MEVAETHSAEHRGLAEELPPQYQEPKEIKTCEDSKNYSASQTTDNSLTISKKNHNSRFYQEPKLLVIKSIA